MFGIWVGVWAGSTSEFWVLTPNEWWAVCDAHADANAMPSKPGEGPIPHEMKLEMAAMVHAEQQRIAIHRAKERRRLG